MARATGTTTDLKDRLMEALRRTFRPEFLNRIDEIVTFQASGPEEIQKIVDIQLAGPPEAAGRAQDHDRADARRPARALAERGYDPVFGARPLKRDIQRMIENPLAVEVLAGRFAEGDHIIVETDRETFRFRKEVAAAVAS